MLDPRLPITLSLLLLLTPACSGPAANTPVVTPTPLPAASSTAPPPFLWRVKTDDKPVFLFGTIHLGVDGKKELPPVVWESFASSNTLIMEADISAINPLELSRFVTLPADQSLKTMISPKAWEMVVRELPAFPAPILERSRPWLVSVSLLETRYPTATPMDQAFLADARESGKQVIFLETWQQQLGMLNATPVEYWLEGIEELVGGTDQLEAKMEDLLAAYRSGDVEATTRALFEDELLDKHPELKEIMFVSRNRQWMDTLVNAIDGGDSTFVATGLGHFLGPEGIVQLLTDRGYQVERVTTQ